MIVGGNSKQVTKTPAFVGDFFFPVASSIFYFLVSVPVFTKQRDGTPFFGMGEEVLDANFSELSSPIYDVTHFLQPKV